MRGERGRALAGSEMRHVLQMLRLGSLSHSGLVGGGGGGGGGGGVGRQPAVAFWSWLLTLTLFITGWHARGHARAGGGLEGPLLSCFGRSMYRLVRGGACQRLVSVCV